MLALKVYHKKLSIDSKIDHIVYAVSNLDEAINSFEQQLGVRPIFGGHHSTFGTKNALINLGNQLYFELLAVDTNNTKVNTPRWMGVDVLSENKITRWALKSAHLEKDSIALKKYHNEMGKSEAGSRNLTDGSLLQWKLTMPLPTPEVEIAPFAIDWSMSNKHPSDMLAPMGCELLALYATHPKPESFKTLFNELKCDFKIEKSPIIAIKAKLQTPKGVVLI